VIPSITVVRMTGGRDRAALPLLVLGPSLGTSAQTLWGECAAGLTGAFDVVAWDLPGHGHNRSVPEEPFTMAELAAGVLRVVDDLLTERGQPRGPFFYAGDSVGGCVGLQLMLDVPDRVVAAAVLCSGARIGTPESWAERIGTVRISGTPALVSASAGRWFGPGFVERSPETASALLHALSDAVDEGYAQVCGALAAYDVRAELPRIAAPVLAIAGADDPATPPASLQEIADGVADGTYVELPGVAHLAPAEAPTEVARLLREHFLGEEPVVEDPGMSEGMRVRRQVLGDAHVDRAVAGTTDFTRDFQELITAYAWGEIWTRPGLDRRSRSMITLTALIARGHHEELAMHVRAALRNGLSVDEIKEVILQSAIYCGVPDANTAFRIASGVLREEGLL